MSSLPTSAALLFAHGGRFTWDEALMVGIPIAVFAGILVAANRRAGEIAAQRDAELADGSSPPDPDEQPPAGTDTAGEHVTPDDPDAPAGGDGPGTDDEVTSR